jgi:hypothetical protein
VVTRAPRTVDLGSVERERLRRLAEKAEALRSACGCATAAAFLVGALALLGIYTLVFEGFDGVSVIGVLLRATAFVIGASVAGKLIGIATARARLAFLYRRLRTGPNVEGD